MKARNIYLTAIIALLLASQLQLEAIAVDPLDVEFSRTNLMLSNNLVLDPVHLSILERHLHFQKPINFETYNAHLRCKPLEGLKKSTFSCAMSTFKGKGYEDLPDFLTEARESSLERLHKLGIHAEFAPAMNSEKNNDPNLALYIHLAKDKPELSSVTLELSEEVSAKRTPDQANVMTTFQIELFGEDTETKGRVPLDIVKAVLDRFEYWWKFANSESKSKPSNVTSETPILTRKNLLQLAKARGKDRDFLAKHLVQFQNLPFDHSNPNPAIYSIYFYGGDLNYFSTTDLYYHFDGTYSYEFEEFNKGTFPKKLS
ncbi:MAG: hypothetical protein KIT34_17655 [Cyanobacteria bacterium TGS_CYA1]|nr:hypothetical protein [Cyanobacteria bacterium TGS_CYA1]